MATSHHAVILDPKKIKSVTVSIVSPSICHEVMGLDAIILAFECCVLSQLFHSPLSPSSRGWRREWQDTLVVLLWEPHEQFGSILATLSQQHWLKSASFPPLYCHSYHGLHWGGFFSLRVYHTKLNSFTFYKYIAFTIKSYKSRSILETYVDCTFVELVLRMGFTG